MQVERSFAGSTGSSRQAAVAIRSARWAFSLFIVHVKAGWTFVDARFDVETVAFRTGDAICWLDSIAGLASRTTLLAVSVWVSEVASFALIDAYLLYIDAWVGLTDWTDLLRYLNSVTLEAMCRTNQTSCLSLVKILQFPTLLFANSIKCKFEARLASVAEPYLVERAR